MIYWCSVSEMDMFGLKRYIQSWPFTLGLSHFVGILHTLFKKCFKVCESGCCFCSLCQDLHTNIFYIVSANKIWEKKFSFGEEETLGEFPANNGSNFV